MKPNSPLRYRDFRLLALARCFGTLGPQMLSVAIGWQVYDLTHSAFAIGLVGFVQFAPSFLLVLYAGHTADQVDRKFIMAAAQFLMAGSATVLAAASYFGFASAPLIYGVAFLLGIARIFGAPAAQALLPTLVPQEIFGNAVALNSMVFQLATICGPMAAGAAFYFGTAAVYTIALGLLLAGGSVALMIHARTKGEKRPFNFEQISAGLKFILKRPVMLGAISLDLFAVLFGGVVALLPIYARDILHIGPQGLGLLRSAPAVGAACMSLYLSRFAIKHRAGFWLFTSVVIFGAATIAFGISTNTLLSTLMLFTLGGADMVSVYVRSHLVQLNTPDYMRGRVSAVGTLFIVTSNELGDFESGLMAGWIGTVPAVIFGGVMSVIIAAFVAWRVPSLRKLSALIPTEAEETTGEAGL